MEIKVFASQYLNYNFWTLVRSDFRADAKIKFDTETRLAVGGLEGEGEDGVGGVLSKIVIS